jgi:predicted DNA-binding protein (MmcQ/YjbR family)
MSKMHWISVALDGSVEKGKIEWLLDLSFDLMNVKKVASESVSQGTILTH